MLDVVIVDDEALARERLTRFLLDLGHEVAGEAKNGEEALALIHEQDPSVVLLDIEMPGINGLQVAEQISQLENPPAVIFTTAYDQYALDAFNTFAAGYLLKPINRQKLHQSLEKAQVINKAQLAAIPVSVAEKNASDVNAANVITAAPQHLTVNSHRGVDLIAIDTIRYFLADSKYITVVGTEGESLIDGTLKQFEKEFAANFVRVHRNALVSIQHIAGLDRAPEGHYTVRLKDLDAQPVVSRRYASKVKALLNTL